MRKKPGKASKESKLFHPVLTQEGKKKSLVLEKVEDLKSFTLD